MIVSFISVRQYSHLRMCSGEHWDSSSKINTSTKMINRYFKCINFRYFANLFGVRERLYLRNRTFEVTHEILIKNTENWFKFVWKSENLAEIFLDCENLSPRNLVHVKVYTNKVTQGGWALTLMFMAVDPRMLLMLAYMMAISALSILNLQPSWAKISNNLLRRTEVVNEHKTRYFFFFRSDLFTTNKSLKQNWWR